MGLYCEFKGKIESLTLVIHLPQEISRFCKYFSGDNGELNVTTPSIVSFTTAGLPRNTHQAPGWKRKW